MIINEPFSKVTDSSIMRTKQTFFTLSPDGLTQFGLDNTFFIDIQRWLKEAILHDHISKIRTFDKFRKWKSFKCWRNALSRNKFQSAKQIIQERHFINCADLRKTFCEIQEVLSGISDMGMIEVGPQRTYTLSEFCKEQFERIQRLDNKLLDFRNLLRETVYDACR